MISPAFACNETIAGFLMKTQQRTSSAKYNLKEYSSAIDYASRALALSKQIGDEIGMFDALKHSYRDVQGD